MGRNGVYHAGQTAVHPLFLGLVVRGVDPAAGFAGWPAEPEIAEHVDYFDVLPHRLPAVRPLSIICRGQLRCEWVVDLCRGHRSRHRFRPWPVAIDFPRPAWPLGWRLGGARSEEGRVGEECVI